MSWFQPSHCAPLRPCHSIPKPQPCTVILPPLRAAALPGGLLQPTALQGEAGSSCYMTAALQGHSYGALGDGADGGEAAKPTAGREEVSVCEEPVGGWCGIQLAPQLRETSADLNLLARLLSAGKAALCSRWRGATAHMLQTFLETSSSPLLLRFAWPECPW